MLDLLLLGLGLMLVFEGIMPFTSPEAWRSTLLKIAAMTNQQIRLIGLVLLIVGMLITLAVL